MVKFIISLGRECPTDNTLKINEKEYCIESDAWNLISIMRYNTDENIRSNREHQSLLKHIYNNFDKDLIDKLSTTTNEEPIEINSKCMHCDIPIEYKGICHDCYKKLDNNF